MLGGRTVTTSKIAITMPTEVPSACQGSHLARSERDFLQLSEIEFACMLETLQQPLIGKRVNDDPPLALLFIADDCDGEDWSSLKHLIINDLRVMI